MSCQSLQIELVERPEGDVIPGKTFRQTSLPAPTEADLQDGQLLLETLYLSLDPAMRGWLDDKRSYLPPVQIGEVMRGYAICRVLASKSSKAQVGDIVTSMIGFIEVRIMPDVAVEVVPLPPKAKITDLLGVLGFTGLTAYYGMAKVAMPKAGETVVVSAAAGATGSVAAQIAKIAGARVVGTAGTDEKVRWLKEVVGLDVALNYKDPDFKKKFKEATPNYIDVYFDNVGGEQLDMALGRANLFARFIACGEISQYNAKEKKGPKNWMNIIAQRITVKGIIVLDFLSEAVAAREQLAQWLSEGKLQRQETIVKGGLKASEDVLNYLFHGKNIGKLMLEVKNPDEGSKL
ncbi:hypothetical protein QBC34DRAFT_426989 [Podospora aff. communis PSN243]|uniref:Dehydrogenase FUB6 n=1 Tax=Podospora aff. communis PSN243 TaxID=3040156 RepID=A0AAV9GIJ4_9PEZI|nr:hypothetical protein QBC34DRAFT_426989 [Podospora aff. communis PSN243]